jgi:hypothetical protein
MYFWVVVTADEASATSHIAKVRKAAPPKLRVMSSLRISEENVFPN